MGANDDDRENELRLKRKEEGGDSYLGYGVPCSVEFHLEKGIPVQMYGKVYRANSELTSPAQAGLSSASPRHTCVVIMMERDIGANEDDTLRTLVVRV